LHTHHHTHHAGDDGRQTRRLALVLALTGAYTVAELVGGWLSNSLALLADAGHMMTDNLALTIALVAAWSARRPPDASRTYGYQRAEILAALFNGVVLALASGAIAWEAWARFRDPPEVQTGLMAIVAAGGLLVNVLGAWVLHGGRARSMNVRAAYLHVLGDLLGSIGALGAAAAMAWTGWRWPDPVASVAIAAIIVFSAVRLVLQAVQVLMEGVPFGLDSEEIRGALRTVPGVSEVHDLHLWSLAGSSAVLTAHVVTDHSRTSGAVLREAAAVLVQRFGIVHVTLQVEPPDFNIVETIDPPPEEPRRG
jgi:cobalt-zinc-cadmium efflux system protein